jgi:hypothetical protein
VLTPYSVIGLKSGSKTWASSWGMNVSRFDVLTTDHTDYTDIRAAAGLFIGAIRVIRG